MNAPKTLLFLLSCVIGGTLGSTSTRGIQCFVPGECLDSQILDARPTNTSRSCLSLCQGLAGCEWFTWYTDSRVCISLSGCLSLTEEKCGSNCISGEQECTEIQCGIQGRCYGALEGIRKVGSDKECGSICGQRSECTWFSYSNQTNSCTMTNDCTVLDRSCNDCQASELACAIDQGSTKAGRNCQANHECLTGLQCKKWRNGKTVCQPSSCIKENERCGQRHGACCTHQDIFCYKPPNVQGVRKKPRCTKLKDIPERKHENLKKLNV